MKNYSTNNYKSLLSLIKKDDTKAYKIIFDSYFKRLMVFSMNYVKDNYAAEEIVENVFLTLWQKRHKMDKIENLKSYLYTMVRNASLDYLKKENKFTRLYDKKHDSLALMDHFIIQEETHAIISQALETLPKKCREVFKLSCIEGLKYKDIAEDLQISINTVKSQRARAIALLKKQLENYIYLQLLFSLQIH